LSTDRDALRRVFKGGDLDVIVVRDSTTQMKTALEFFQTNRDNKAVGAVEMAIDNRNQLEHTQQRIAELERALEEMKREESPKAYAIMSKGFVAQIEQMRREIDEYLGVSREEVEEPEVVTK